MHASVATTSDIKGHWAEVQITSWMNQGLVKGYTDGAFKPNNSVSRAEFMTIVNAAFGFSDTSSTTFSDVRSTDWFFSQIGAAVHAGYIEGYPDKSMLPNKNLTREEVAVMVNRLLKLKQVDISEDIVFIDAEKNFHLLRILR